mgnify:CR=1 FL=1
MELCSRCHKRFAVVYVTRIEGDKTINEGICLSCAKELGIKQVDDILKKMGIDDESLEQLDDEVMGLIGENGQVPEQTPQGDAEDDAENGDSRAPAIDFGKLFGSFANRPENAPGADRGDAAKQQEEPQGKGRAKRKYLSAYCLDLTQKAKEGKLDRIVGRERELARMMQILCRRQKNNPCLIGEPGVGKTAIAEALAIEIANGSVPGKLRGKEIQLVDLTAIVAGTQFRGQFESRMKGLIDEVKAQGNVILVIDEVHNIASAGDAEGSMNAANILKPALSRGEIQVIGATTLAEYRKYIEKDSALERRFQPILVEEPSVGDSVEILKGIKGYYEQFHGIRIPDDIARRAVVMAERYIQDRFLPDKAIDLLDEACAYVALHSPLIREVEDVQAQRELIRSEMAVLQEQIKNEQAPPQQVYQQLAEHKSSEMQHTLRIEELEKKREEITLGVEDLAHVIEVWTGIPASSITENEFERLDRLMLRLKEHIVGQDEAVDAVSRAIRRNRVGISPKKRPVSFIFVGPTGVGKTELVKQLASDLFDNVDSLIRLDMSEYMEKHTVSKLIGSPPGYVGYDEAGQLTEKIRRRPYSIVLFDEIEKAHPDVLNILLQVLDDGRITDAQGRVVNFENTIIVMTSNAGSEGSVGGMGFGRSDGDKVKEKTMKALQGFLRPEFLNRVDEIITFNHLTEENFLGIADIMLKELQDGLSTRGLNLFWDDDLRQLLVKKAYSVTYGARNLRRTIQKELEDPISEAIIDSFEHPISAIRIRVEGETVKLDIT